MKVLIKIYVGISRFIYLFFKLLPVKNKIVMISRQSNEVNKDFKLLGQELEKRYTVVYLCKTLDKGIQATLKSKIVYGLHSIKQMYHLSTSKVCILDSYCPTVSILKHKKKLTIIQMWHSIGTMKKFGYLILDSTEGSKSEVAEAMHMHENYDVVLCASEAYKNHLAAGFKCSKEKIVIKTLPRVDLLFDKEYESKVRENIFKVYPMLKSKKNIVYAPTFRKKEKELKKAINDLIKHLDFSKYNLIVKMHPLSKTKINNQKVICDFSFSTFDMLFIADIFVSDYSCVIYEAGLRGIPLYFYDFDLDDYKVKRGLSLNYTEVPGYTRKKAKDLVLTFEKEYNYEELRKFIDKYVTNKKECTKSLVQLIETYMK